MELLCPDSGLQLHGRCWYLSVQGTSCATTCFAHGLDFSLVVASHATPVIPRLLGRPPGIKEAPWGRLECYLQPLDQYFTAKEIPDADAGDTTHDAKNWATSFCRLACPCTLSGISTRHQALIGSGVCALPFHRLAVCCLQAPEDCWNRDRSGAALLRNYRCCCKGVPLLGDSCPLFGELLAFTSGTGRAHGYAELPSKVCVQKGMIHDELESQLRRRRTLKECALLHLIVHLLSVRVPGPVKVVDVGASIGGCSAPLASLGAEVLAFEAHPRTFALLNATAQRLNRRANGTLKAFNLALSDRHRIAQMIEPYLNAAASSTLPPHMILPHFAERGLIWPVEEQKLDVILRKLGSGRIHLMKIDAEGDEIRVLRGAFGLMEDPTSRPYFIKFEFYPVRLRHRGHDPCVLLTYLLSKGYALLVLQSAGSGDSQGACWIWAEVGVSSLVQRFVEDSRWTDILAVQRSGNILQHGYVSYLMTTVSNCSSRHA